MSQNAAKKILQPSTLQNSSNKPEWRIASPLQIQNYHPNYAEVFNTAQQPQKHNIEIIREMKKWIFAVEAASNNDGILLLSLVKLQSSLSQWCGTLEKMFTSLLLSEKKTFDQRISSHITDAEIKMHQQQLDIRDQQIATLTKRLEEKQQQLQMAHNNSLQALRKIKQIEELMGLLKIKQIQDCPVCGQLNQIVKVVSKSQKSINAVNQDVIDEKAVVHSMLKGIQCHLQQLKQERQMQLVNARGRGSVYW